jgi:hypothetical protein
VKIFKFEIKAPNEHKEIGDAAVCVSEVSGEEVEGGASGLEA